MPGTREKLFEELEDWAENRNPTFSDKQVYVLSAGAGTGKSTIASEFARRLDDKGRLGASFLFVRGVEDLGSIRLLFSTIAYQLARAHDTLFPHIAEAARAHWKRTRIQQAQYELQNLFETPLSFATVHHPPLVIVIDALDECSADDPDGVPDMLQWLLRSLRAISFDLRIFVTTRPDEKVEGALRAPEFADLINFRSLHDLPREWVDRDIRRFFEHTLLKVPSRDTLLQVHPNAAEKLTMLADGLFVYARTAIDFIGGYPDCPEERLEILLSDKVGSGLAPLDRLYLSVLLIAFPPDKYTDYAPARERVQTILLSLALLRDHISPRTLSDLVRITVPSARALLGRLRAVVLYDVDDADSLTRPLHATFPQFLINDKRCTHDLYRVQHEAGQHALAVGCLETLLGRERDQSGLKPNPCELEDATIPKADISDLKERVREKIPLVTQYACLHWAAHITVSEREDGLRERLVDFVHTKMVMWLETLCYMGRLDAAIRAMDGARAWYEV